MPQRLLSDERLVALVRRGDRAAFASLYDRHAAELLSFCFFMLGSREDAEDAVQSTFASAYRALLRDERAIDARPWLFAIARNACIGTLRRRRPHEAEPSPPGEDLFTRVERRERVRELLAGMLELPERHRTALVLAELHGRSHREIAHVLGVSLSTVKSYVFQARAALASERLAHETDCREIREELAVARGPALLRGRLRRHLRACAGCREYADRVSRRRRSLGAIAPLAPTIALKRRVLDATVGRGAAGAGAGGAGAVAGGAIELGGAGAKVLVAKALIAAAGVGAGTVAVANGVSAPARGPAVVAIQATARSGRPASGFSSRAPAAVGAPAPTDPAGQRVAAGAPTPGTLAAGPAGGKRTEPAVRGVIARGAAAEAEPVAAGRPVEAAGGAPGHAGGSGRGNSSEHGPGQGRGNSAGHGNAGGNSNGRGADAPGRGKSAAHGPGTPVPAGAVRSAGASQPPAHGSAPGQALGNAHAPALGTAVPAGAAVQPPGPPTPAERPSAGTPPENHMASPRAAGDSGPPGDSGRESPAHPPPVQESPGHTGG